MDSSATPLVILSGPVGVGKTSVGNEMSEQLMERKVPHTYVDLDALAQTFPRSNDDPFGSRLAAKNLGTVWSNAVEAGSRNLIVGRVVETRGDVKAIENAIPGSKAIVFQLQASDEVLRARVGRRELGSGHDRHADRAVALADSLRESGPCDYMVGTDGRTISDIAQEIVGKVAWQGATQQ